MTTNISFDPLRPSTHGPPTISSNHPTTANTPPPPLNLIAVFLAVAALLPFLLHLHQEYLAFLALGPGGTPSTFAGFLRVKALGLFALRDVYTPRAGVGSSSAKTVDADADSDAVDADAALVDSMHHEPPYTSKGNTKEGPGERRLTGRIGDLTDTYSSLCIAPVAEGIQPSSRTYPRTTPQLRKVHKCEHHTAHVLPQRKGPRPETRGIAPHRQVTQRGSPETFAQTAAALREMTERYAGVLAVGTSCFEPHTVGLFVLRSSAVARDVDGGDGHTAVISREQQAPTSSSPHQAPECSSEAGGTALEYKTIEKGNGEKKVNKSKSKHKHCGAEIAHVHPSDGSLHVVLAPRDVDAVLASAWGERHPLARGGWWERFVPEGFVMVYAPREEREVEIVMGIVEMGVEGFLREGGRR